MLSVEHAPAFYRSPSSGLMPSDPSTFQRFMQAMASRYAGKVKAYEMWNEENLAREAGQGNVDPSTYLPLLKAGYTGTKAGDSNAQVFLGALSPTGANQPGVSMDDLAYLKALYALNNGEVKNYFDVLARAPERLFESARLHARAHPQCSLSGGWNNDPSFFAFYPARPVPRRDDPGRRREQEDLADASSATTRARSPCRATSTRRSSPRTPRRAFWSRPSRSPARRRYIGGVIVWNLNYQMIVPQTDEKWGFAVLRADFTPRPAFSALASMPKT